jgi:hypothetical protein
MEERERCFFILSGIPHESMIKSVINKIITDITGQSLLIVSNYFILIHNEDGCDTDCSTVCIMCRARISSAT